MKIIDNVYVVPGVAANPYLIVDADGLTVIDAGLLRSQKKILAYVASLGQHLNGSKLPLERVLPVPVTAQ
jgi:hypothetical protein